MRGLKGKVAIVTASTAGIGLATARRLGQEGASIIISSRKKKNVVEAEEALKKDGIRVKGVVCHVGNAEQRKEMIQTAVKEFGGIDILVSNAAVNPGIGPIVDMSESEIDKILEINVKAAILLVRDTLPHMGTGGSILFISSIAGFSPESPLGVYGVSKTALLGLTKGLAKELSPDIRVNCVAPGFVPTHFAEAIISNETSKQETVERTLLKRLGTPEDIASAVAFLVSEDASYITGETLIVSGGMQSRL